MFTSACQALGTGGVPSHACCLPAPSQTLASDNPCSWCIALQTVTTFCATQYGFWTSAAQNVSYPFPWNFFNSRPSSVSPCVTLTPRSSTFISCASSCLLYLLQAVVNTSAELQTWSPAELAPMGRFCWPSSCAALPL